MLRSTFCQQSQPSHFSAHILLCALTLLQLLLQFSDRRIGVPRVTFGRLLDLSRPLRFIPLLPPVVAARWPDVARA